jgi:hypothetical protein
MNSAEIIRNYLLGQKDKLGFSLSHARLESPHKAQIILSIHISIWPLVETQDIIHLQGISIDTARNLPHDKKIEGLTAREDEEYHYFGGFKAFDTVGTSIIAISDADVAHEIKRRSRGRHTTLIDTCMITPIFRLVEVTTYPGKRFVEMDPDTVGWFPEKISKRLLKSPPK